MRRIFFHGEASVFDGKHTHEKGKTFRCLTSCVLRCFLPRRLTPMDISRSRWVALYVTTGDRATALENIFLVCRRGSRGNHPKEHGSIHACYSHEYHSTILLADNPYTPPPPRPVPHAPHPAHSTADRMPCKARDSSSSTNPCWEKCCFAARWFLPK